MKTLVNEEQNTPATGLDSARTAHPALTVSEALKQYPAPWQYEMVERFSDETEDALCISAANRSSISEMQCPRDVEEPLAKLMTAAPALYKALERITMIAGNLPDETLESCGGINEGRGRALMALSARTIARAALALVDTVESPE